MAAGPGVFGSGAKVIGPLKVGDHVAVGVPVHVISQAGSDDFVVFTDD